MLTNLHRGLSCGLMNIKSCDEVYAFILYLFDFCLGSSEVGSCITDSWGRESYMDDEDGGTVADKVTRFVSRFVDRVGTEAGISQEHLKSLYTMIPGQSCKAGDKKSPKSRK